MTKSILMSVPNMSIPPGKRDFFSRKAWIIHKDIYCGDFWSRKKWQYQYVD
jgi:hypothetical protein